MARIKYQLTALNPGNIVSGSLCVITRKYNGNSYPYDSSDPTNNYIYNTVGRSATQDGGIGNSWYFLGAGICSYKTPYYYISVNSVTYTFDAAGKPISSNAANYTLYSAVILNRTIAVGTVIPTNTDATQNLSVSENGATRGSIPESSSSTSPETSIVYDDDAKKVVAINQLNARDEFAAAALRGMLNHIDDPSTMSKNEMFYLCDTSYKWAENMMTAAANARAGYSAQGYNADPMNSLIDAVDRDSQLEFTIAGTGITVNSGQSASYPGNSTFNLALSSSYLTNFLSSWKTTNQILNWGSLTTSGEEKIDASHLPDGTLTWSDLINAGNSEKINISHLPEGILTWSNLSTYDSNNSHKVAGKYIDGTWWGQTMQAGNIVNGDLQDVGNIYLKGGSEQFSMRYIENGSTDSKAVIIIHPVTNISPVLSIGYGTRYERKTQLHGKEIEFIVQNASATSASQPDGTGITAMTIIGREGSTNGVPGNIGIGTSNPDSKLQVNGKAHVTSLQIGDILLTSEGGNTLKVATNGGSAANIYATGGVSSIMQNASINSDKKFYFDSTHYLHVDNGVLKYFNGSTDKTVNLT